MPITADRPAPYAPASAIIDLIDRHRNRGLPTPVTAEVLARAGISDSLIPRTLQALQTLDLIGEDGSPTEILESIRLAPEAQYKDRLIEWLQSAYADALVFVDPATATDTDVRDAFRSYRPVGQQPRMVTLFLGLFAAAGLGPEKPQRQQAPKKVVKANRITARSLARPQSLDVANTVQSVAPQPSIPAPIAGMLSSLPKPGEAWTREERDRFVSTLGTVLDFCFPVIGAKQNSEKRAREDSQ